MVEGISKFKKVFERGWLLAALQVIGLLSTKIQNNLTKLSSTYDSLPGNSGSPVFGENYQVKGIHVSGGASVNYMQNLENVEKWIEVGRSLSE